MPEKNPFYHNFNLYWFAITGLGIWMLFVHGPQYLVRLNVIGPVLWVHLLSVYPIYLACMHNTILTPSTFPWARLHHVWLGRVGLSLGVVGFVTGCFLAWPARNFGSSIGITIGGTAQMVSSILGYRDIRQFQQCKREIAELQEQQEQQNSTASDAEETETQTANKQKDQSETSAVDTSASTKLEELKKKRDKALKGHIGNMLGVFFMGCGIPSLMRLPLRRFWIAFVLMGAAGVAAYLHYRIFVRRIDDKEERRDTSDTSAVPPTTSKEETA